MRQAGAGLEPVEALGRALAGDELAVALVDVGGDQLGALGIGARHHDRGHAAHVGSEPRGVKVALMRRRRDQNLAAEVSALLLGCQLVLEVHAGRAGVDERLHDLEGVERPAEAGLRVGNDRREPVALGAAFRMLDLIGADERLVDATAQVGRRIGRVEALVGIDLAGRIGVGRDLPSREIDGLQAGADHLHRLVAGHGAEARHVGFRLQQLPQPVGAALGQRVADRQRAAQARHVLRGVWPLDAIVTADGSARNQVVEARHCGLLIQP